MSDYTQHTQGKAIVREWTCHAPTTVGVVVGDKFQPIAECSGHGQLAAYAAADARRIAACLNACAGLSTEALEGSSAAPVGFGFESAPMPTAVFDDQLEQEKKRTAKAERIASRLAAALHLLLHELEGESPPPPPAYVVAVARRARNQAIEEINQFEEV